MRELSALPSFIAELGRGGPWKWILAAGVALVDYALPSEALRQIAIGAGVMIALDTALGVLSAVVNGEKLSSRKFGRVMVKSLGYLIVVLACATATRSVAGLSQLQEPTITGVLALVLATEFTSLLEHAQKLGLPLPEKLRSLLAGSEPEKP